jgi:hypothetical protein
MAMWKTRGLNPLDNVVSNPRASPRNHEQDPIPVEISRAPGRRPKVEKERLTVHLPVDLIDRLKNAVYWTPGLTLAGLAEEVFQEAVERIEKERGEPFPPRKRELTGGRPLK